MLVEGREAREEMKKAAELDIQRKRLQHILMCPFGVLLCSVLKVCYQCILVGYSKSSNKWSNLIIAHYISAIIPMCNCLIDLKALVKANKLPSVRR